MLVLKALNQIWMLKQPDVISLELKKDLGHLLAVGLQREGLQTSGRGQSIC